MANSVAYEQLVIDSSPAGPSSVAFAKDKPIAVSAIFYLDPRSSSAVRWRSDGENPNPNHGFPLLPGSAMALAGRMNIRRARFVSESGEQQVLHVAYFDQVDVLAIQFSAVDPATAAVGNAPRLAAVLAELVTYQKAIVLALSLLSNEAAFSVEDVLR